MLLQFDINESTAIKGLKNNINKLKPRWSVIDNIFDYANKIEFYLIIYISIYYVQSRKEKIE